VSYSKNHMGRFFAVSVALAALACGGKVEGPGTQPVGEPSPSTGSTPTPGGSASSTPTPTPVPTGCEQGASCPEGSACGGGGYNCTYSCSCVNGTMECDGPPCPTTPPACPAFQPYPTTACPWPNQECGYTTTQNSCGAVDCTCNEQGVWDCEPTCVELDAGVGLDAGVSFDAAGE
jgi:hypothetical protein